MARGGKRLAKGTFSLQFCSLTSCHAEMIERLSLNSGVHSVPKLHAAGFDISKFANAICILLIFMVLLKQT